jgi:hypothetical protein
VHGYVAIASYHSLNPMHCNYVGVSYLHICDRPRGTELAPVEDVDYEQDQGKLWYI